MGTNSGKKARKSIGEDSGRVGFRSVQPLNYIQETYIDALKDNQVIFGIGSTGTGKTYIATSYAAELLYYKQIDKIIITRPNVEAGPTLGHLPGELEEKYMPYLVPFIDTFNEKLGSSFTDYCIKSKAIEAIPIGFLRGRSFKDCLVILDEAQNTTPAQMKLLLSRIGTNCKMVVDGDIKQCDLKGPNGLEDAVDKLEGIQGIEVVRFLDSDIIRSPLCKKIILAYNK